MGRDYITDPEALIPVLQEPLCTITGTEQPGLRMRNQLRRDLFHQRAMTTLALEAAAETAVLEQLRVPAHNTATDEDAVVRAEDGGSIAILSGHRPVRWAPPSAASGET